MWETRTNKMYIEGILQYKQLLLYPPSSESVLTDSPLAPPGFCLQYQYKLHPPFSRFLRPNRVPKTKQEKQVFEIYKFNLRFTLKISV